MNATVFKPIIPRKFSGHAELEFDVDWNGGDSYRSQVFNAISMSLPVGEKWIIDTVKRAVNTMPLETKARWHPYSRDFTSQESTHSFIHRKYNLRLAALGLINWCEGKLKKQVEWGETCTPINQLASSVAYEYLTSSFCSALMRSNGWLSGADPELAMIWLWHASEELEHKHFVYELYCATGGGTMRRMLWFLWSAPIFLYQLHVQIALNLHRSGTLYKFSTLRQALSFNFGKNGLFWVTSINMIKFLNPYFRPEDDDGDVLARKWLEQNGSLLKKIRQTDRPFSC